ncbi:MAG TPA: DinB family protein [Longimicrobium sp.]
MSTATATETGEIQGYRLHARLADVCVKVNTEGVTHEESLRAPEPGGNSLNWVVGHLCCIYNNALPLLGQEPVGDRGSLARYDRGSAPITPAEALPLGQLLETWDALARRFDAGLAGLTPEYLDQAAPFSPSNDPGETVRSLVNTLLFHQAYHAGQTGVLRRVAGHEGAVK